METIREFYGGTTLNCNDIEHFMNKGKVELKYYKIISDIMEKKKKSKKYGIEVVKKRVEKNIITEEKKEIFNFTEKEEVAERVLELLKINKVSPINVVDILDDLTASRSSILTK